MYKKGSEWRKWDLHIHSNASDGNGTPSQIVDKAVEEGISVIALTDHHTVKNIDKIKEYAKDKNINVISGIEFRTEYGDKSVHMIGLFPDKYGNIKLDEKALNELILSPLNLSETFIVAKGKDSDPSLSDEKAFKKGMFEVQVDFKKASDLIRKYGGIVTVHSSDKYGSIETMKHSGKSDKNVKKISDSLGPVKEDILTNYVDFCEMSSLNSKDSEFYLERFNRCTIIASDAHDYNDIGKIYTWIKADPNINGLLHASIEPERIFIGEIPPALDRVNKNKTKTLEKLSIMWEDSYNGSKGEWFKNVEIPINSEMTAVIGNKGSCKTAVAEIIALLSNCKNSSDFVFLNKTRFKNKKLASNFKAKLTWFGNVLESTKNLDLESDSSSDELIHFVPQRSFEAFCNDSDEKFEEEINKVVFSRMPEEEKLGFFDFKNLLQNKKESITEKKNKLSIQIKKINEKIKEKEKERDQKVLNTVMSSIKKNELEEKEHEKIKPKIINPPEDLYTEEYQDLLKNYEEIQEQILEKQSKLNELFQNESELSIVNDSINDLNNIVNEAVNKFKDRLEAYNIDIKKVFNFSMDLNLVDCKIKDFKDQINKIKSEISEEPDKLGNLIISKNNIKNKIDIFNTENNGKMTKYQKYLDDEKQWKEKEKEIKNEKNELDLRLKYLGDLTNSPLIEEINEMRKERMNIVKEIFNVCKEEVDIYNNLKEPITKFIKTYKNQLENYDVKIDVGLYPTDEFSFSFVETYIDSSVSSNFRGDEGQKVFKDIIDESNFLNFEDVEKFIDKIQNSLDETIDSKNIRCYHNIFKKDKYDLFVEKFYNLSFLKVRYSLQLYGKPLQELSPGERGSLLLVFYLLLDARDIPLVLDQPEDNLDNESVAKILVPFIREAKKRRQIIIITHNSNLAVVSDAEQVIRVKLDKTNNKFSLESGSLESKIIYDVVDVLEGTKNSFKIRQSKYKI